ncbi:hypothetical protein [Flavobacterium akiainvivens]|uniref:hypothetical protein n=1 Tax=Flavobacterium akiainvivens TaxID=1202724 RepID=UPI0006C83AD6|nr:hypothetical protein [Flavobacterium akiainvivens]SFQ61216.1 hypothetical protein SAMN05444144_1108 [Flavobacterium akiainvivens]
MNKPILLKLFLALFLVTLGSCESEPVDPAVLDNVPPENPQNPGENPGGGNTDNGTSEGDYWPFALNNEWVFDSTGEEVSPMKIIGTETIDGVQYYKMNYAFTDSGNEELTGTTDVYLRKEGGTYYQRVVTYIPEENGMSMTVTPYEFVMLKDYLEVGETWTHTVSFTTSYEMIDMPDFPMPIPDITTEITMDGTIMEKGATVTVNGTTYNDVIKQKIVQTVSMEVPGSSETIETSVTSYVWFAKDVGPIRSENQSELMETYILTLTDYTLN